ITGWAMARKNEALFKPFLFADQELDALVADLAPRAGALAEAKSKLDAGDPGEAEVVLTAAMLTRPDEVGAWHRLAPPPAPGRRGDPPAPAPAPRAPPPPPRRTPRPPPAPTAPPRP